MNISKGWKKWMAVGCSHGDQIDPEARKAVLTFRDRWKPDTTFHLGDFLDLAAFRSGAVNDPNSADRAASVSDDLSAGIDFLHELRPQHILFGNHEARLYKLAASPNALAAHAATLTLQAIEDAAKKLKARTYPYHIRSYAELGRNSFTATCSTSKPSATTLRHTATVSSLTCTESAANALERLTAQQVTAPACSHDSIWSMRAHAAQPWDGVKDSPTDFTTTKAQQ